MRFSVTLLVTVIFAAVLLVYIQMDRTANIQKATEGAVQKEADRLLPLADGSPLVKIRIQNPKSYENMTLIKNDQGWQLQTPVKAPADPLIAQGLVTALNVSQKVRRLKREKDWSEYGLQKPAMVLGIQTQDMAREKNLLFGDDSPLGGLCFARWEDAGDDYFMLPKDLKAAFSISVYSLRQKQVFSLDPKIINRIRVKTPREEFEMARHKDKWFWMEPIPIMGEFIPAQDAEDLAGMIQPLAVKEFKDDSFLDLDRLGLGKDASEMLISDGDITESIKVGQELPDQEAYQCTSSRMASVLMISSTRIQSIFAKVEAMAGVSAAAKNAVAETASPLETGTSDSPTPSQDSLTSRGDTIDELLAGL